MMLSERVRDLRHRVAEIVGGVSGPQDYELDGAILAAFEELACVTERAAIKQERERYAAVVGQYWDEYDHDQVIRSLLSRLVLAINHPTDTTLPP